jgi:hypothetical protein
MAAIMLLTASAAAADESPQVTLEPVAVSVSGQSMTIDVDQPDRCSWQLAVDVILDKKNPPDAVIRIVGSRANPADICAQVLTRTTVTAAFPVGAASIRSAEGVVLWVRPTRTTVAFQARSTAGQLIVTTRAASSPVPTKIEVRATAKGYRTLISTIRAKDLVPWSGSTQLVMPRAVPRVTYKVRVVVQFSDGSTVTSPTLSIKAR